MLTVPVPSGFGALTVIIIKGYFIIGFMQSMFVYVSHICNVILYVILPDVLLWWSKINGATNVFGRGPPWRT